MAYLGSTSGSSAGSSGTTATRSARPTGSGAGVANGRGAGRAAAGGAAPRVAGRPYDEGRDWRRLATFGGGIAIGALVGAGIALLFAPAAGEETRELLAERARAARDLVRDRFDDFRGGVRHAARRGRRGVRRGLARSRWALEDAYDHGLRRLR